jgi:hypothetical protein
MAKREAYAAFILTTISMTLPQTDEFSLEDGQRVRIRKPGGFQHVRGA